MPDPARSVEGEAAHIMSAYSRAATGCPRTYRRIARGDSRRRKGSIWLPLPEHPLEGPQYGRRVRDRLVIIGAAVSAVGGEMASVKALGQWSRPPMSPA